MGCVSQILNMTFFIIFLLISFLCTQILILGTTSINVTGEYGVKEEDNGDRRENHIEKVSGEDENEEKEGLILEKFRALLGIRRPTYGSASPSPSPSPLPAIEVEAPSPAPVLPIHHRHPPPSHRSRLIPSPPYKEGREKGRGRRILVAVLVSAGATCVICGIGLIWGCGKFRKQKRRSTSTVLTIHSTGGGSRNRSKYVNSSQNSVKKVTSDPDPDLFYLDSIGTALDPQPFCLKPNSETVNSSSSNQNISYWALKEVEESEKELIKSGYDDVSCSDVGEIVSVHETEVESIKYETVGGCSSPHDAVIIHVEARSSDDESFHSLCNSHSSNARLSNASAGSLSDTSEIASPNVSKVSPCSVTLSIPRPSPDTNSQSYAPQAPQPLPPPPPPPPPLPRVHVYPSYSSSSSTRITTKGMSSATLPNLSSPRNSNSSSGSNQTPRSDLPLSPPNPPKPPVGIPPPPCPPPFSKGNINFLKGPPPPPSHLPHYTPLGKDGSPLPKLKPLHWDKVRAAPDRSMVWDKLRSSSFEFDEKMIESLFGYNLQNSMKNEEAKSKSPSPGKHVLEPKRLQNITILAKALNATSEQICDALIQGGGLCLQQLEALFKMEPTKDEEAKLTSYKGDINELGSAERFVKAMLKIPFAFLRIEAMLYRETFEDEVVHLRKSFSMLEEACKELRSSRLFLKLLEAVLKTGNRMNVGTIRGGARAFKLDALLKLADVKGTDGKTTLLHFVVQEIVRSEGIRVSESIIGRINQKSKSKNVEDREEDYRRMGLDLVSGLCTELCNVKKTATIDLDVLASSVTNLSDGMTKLKHLVLKDLSMEEKSGNFVHSMRSFMNYAGKNLMELQEDEHRVLLHVREITEYFHGNLSKDEANPLRIFVIVRDFLGMLDHVCKELRSSKVPNSPNPLAPFR